MPSSEPYYNLSGASREEKHSDNLSSFESAVKAKVTSLRIAVEAHVQHADIQKKLYRWVEDLFEDYISRISTRDAGYIARLSEDWVKETIAIFGDIFEPIIFDYDVGPIFEIFVGTMEHLEKMTDGFIKDINHTILERELPINNTDTSAEPSRHKGKKIKTIADHIVDKTRTEEIAKKLHPFFDGEKGLGKRHLLMI